MRRRKEGKSTKPKKFVLEAAVISALRRAFNRSIIYAQVKEAAKVEVPHFNKDGSRSKSKRVNYRCSDCGGLFPDKKIPVTNKKGEKVSKKAFAVDHTEPVVDPEKGMKRRENGKIDWSEYVDRMFAYVDFYDPKIHNYLNSLAGKFSVLCHVCHDKKTLIENNVRKQKAKSNKPSKKQKKGKVSANEKKK
jgi:hypothetical protein